MTLAVGLDTAQERRRLRTLVLGLAGLRAMVGGIAVVVAPFLWDRHFAVLGLLRPTKEVLLAGGYLAKVGDVSLPVIVLAALPILLPGVWIFYFLGRAFADEIERCDLPGIAGRLLPPDRIHRMQEVLDKRGARVVFLGRLAAMPSSIVAAAAGSSEMPVRTFLIADTLGGLTSLAGVVAAGWVLGDMYERAGPWLAGVSFVVLVVLVVLFGRWLRKT